MSPATETQIKPVIFTSPYPNLRLVRIATDTVRNEGGRKIGSVAPGSPQNERYGITDDGAPWEVQFEKGIFQTSDPILIEWLRNHKPYDPSTGTGNPDVESGGYGMDFYEQDAAPEEPKPTLSEQQERISVATARLDVADLEAVLGEERAAHNREPVIRGAEAALRAIAEGPSEQEAATEQSTDGGGTDGPDGPHD